jgi:hypothetical protein
MSDTPEYTEYEQTVLDLLTEIAMSLRDLRRVLL